MITVTVHASKAYDVCIGSGLLARAGALAKGALSPCRALILTDDNIAPLYADTLTDSLQHAGFAPEVYVVPHGESSKSLATLGEVLEHLASKTYTRTDALFALGGGVVGDLGGFCASVYLRGMPFVQVPTTLLAAVDSSVGGKTAINLDAGKNLAGAFYQPRLVICDTDTLATLPPDIFADGCAEVVKYGMINDQDLFRMLQSGASPASEHIIARCVQNKRDLVEQDEFDADVRRLLNLGHTVAHAIETLSSFEISHGKAVAMGMISIARAAVAHGLCAKNDLDALITLTQTLGLPTECPYGTAEIATAALSDKKRSGERITLVVPYAVGDSRLYELPAAALQAWLEAR